MESIAKTPELDPLISKQLSAWAKFFRTGTAKDEAMAAQATIDAGESKSRLRVHLGPSESYWQDNTKFPYLLQVGVVDQAAADKLTTTFAPSVQSMESRFNGLGGYQSRTVSLRGGFASPMTQAVIGGFIQSYFAGEPGGNNFPNYSGYQHGFGLEGSSRFILNDSNFIGKTLITDADRERSLSIYDDNTKDFIKSHNSDEFKTYVISIFTSCHETGHLLGPQRSTMTAKGVPLSVAFGEHWGSADEPKADLLSVVQTAELAKNGQVDADLLNSVCSLLATRSVSNYFPGRDGFKDKIKVADHTFGSIMILGWYLKTQAITWEADNSGQKHLAIHFDKIPDSSRQLLDKIVTYEAQGDKDGYLAFAQQTVLENIPDDLDLALKAVRNPKAAKTYKLNRIIVDKNGNKL